MKFPLNLATEPFRRDRLVLFASGAVGAMMVASLVLLLSLVLADRRRSADTRHEIARLDQQIGRAAAEQARLDSILRQPENAAVLERSLFLNEILSWKSISWTTLIADLEHILPPDVRLVSIHPQVVTEGQVSLDMMLESESIPPEVETVRRLESSAEFSAATVHNTTPPSTASPYHRCRVSVNYSQNLK